MDRSYRFEFYRQWLDEAADFEEACEVLRCASHDSDLEPCEFYAIRYRFDSRYRLGVKA